MKNQNQRMSEFSDSGCKVYNFPITDNHLEIGLSYMRNLKERKR